MKRKPISILLSLGAMALILGGCSANSPKNSAQTSAHPSNPGSNATKQAVAELSSTSNTHVNGSANLSLDLKTNEMTVTVQASGLQPNSSHPEHIHLGTCSKPGSPVYPLQNLVTNKDGNGTSTTIIKNVKVIPSSSWIVNLHEGPDLQGAHAQQVSCGAVTLK